MFGTYHAEDVTLLLKDITGKVRPMSASEREPLIQSGIHYSAMLPLEYEPSPSYMEAYNHALNRYAKITAEAVAIVSRKILSHKGEHVVLVSLARAGTSIGVLIKHYMEKTFHLKIPHYSISIIRGIGIDHNAMNHILDRHLPEMIQFVDGWTGKGAIQQQLISSMQDYPGVSPDLAVLSDPAHITEKYGTREDFLIASSCLNSTVSGLLSRTFLREDIIAKDDFHGAAFYSELLSKDLTYQFIDKIELYFHQSGCIHEQAYQEERSGLEEVKEIGKHFHIADINLIKPGIGETTRVLLRRLPWKILVHSLKDYENLNHLYRLAEEKEVPVEEYPLKNYKACGIIR